MANANDILRRAAAEIGYCRWDDELAGTIFGRWYAQKTGSSYFGTNGVPFCAMFVSWVFDQCGEEEPYLPTAGCGTMLARARSAGLVLSDTRNAVPGDVVIFDWGYDDIGHDHVGLVEANRGGYLQTIEGNTTGADGRSGSVARRTRAFKNNGRGRPQIMAVIRPAYNGGSSTTAPVPDGSLAVDGVWGEATTLKAQQVLNAPYKDGEISRQPQMHLSRHKGCGSGWEYAGWLGEEPGSQTIRMLQEIWGCAADGFFGPDTINAMIRYYQKDSGATALDGVIDYPSITVKAFQRALNDGRI